MMLDFSTPNSKALKGVHDLLYFSNGMTFEQALADVKSVAPQLADASIGKIMGVAVGNYCPQYQSKFN